MKSTLSTVGRILYALVIGLFGVFHFLNGDAMVGMVPIPGGIIWIYLTGVALILAAVSIIIKKKTSLATLLLGIMLVIFALSIHLPGGEASMPSLLKDLGLAGAAFFISGNSED